MHRAPKAMQDGSATEATTPQSVKPMGGTAAKRTTTEPSSMSDTNAAEEEWIDTTELVRTAVDAGASGLFVATIVTDRSAMPAETVAYAVKNDRDVARHCRGGHFMTALWDGDIEEVFAYADSANTELLESIDLLEGVEVTA